MSTSPPLRYAVFGHPIAHSLSPAIHQAFARQSGLALEYHAIDAAPAAFADAVNRFFAEGGRGANVTVPHKAAAFALAASASDAATRVGCANVLTGMPDGRLAAHNTDGAGLVRDLTVRHHCDLRGQRALLLGAGGAARGVAWNLLDAGLAALTIVNRSPAAATALAGAIGDAAPVRARDWSDLAALGPYDLVLNATSAGVHGHALALPASLVGAHSFCYDLSYGAAAGTFLAWAQAAGAGAAVDGLGMLVETAADTFELWHGRRPETDPVYRQLRAASSVR